MSWKKLIVLAKCSIRNFLVMSGYELEEVNSFGDALKNVDLAKSYVWGTNISVSEVEKNLEGLLKYNYMETIVESYFSYEEALLDVVESSGESIEISGKRIHEYSNILYHQMILYPDSILPIFDHVFSLHATKLKRELDNEVYKRICGNKEKVYKLETPNEKVTEEKYNVSVEIHELLIEQVISIKDLCNEHIDRLVSVKGMIIKISNVIPNLVSGVFKCKNCKAMYRIAVKNNRIEMEEMGICAHCGKKFQLEIVYNMSEFKDQQNFVVQESPKDMKKGETPVTITVTLHGKKVGKYHAGDTVFVTGIYRVSSWRVNPKSRRSFSMFSSYLSAISTKVLNFTKDQKRENNKNQFSKEEEEFFYYLSNHKELYKILVNSFGNTVFGMENLKLGLLCQIVGGSKKGNSNLALNEFRSNIHILLVGDPGTSKSQLLNVSKEISERGIYTTGKGTTTVGLTAYITKDVETSEFILEPGALVLADHGLVIIDEFDKMDQKSQTILHEVMEQQTVSVAKAGITATLNARTSILASANPIHSHFNTSLSIVENVKIPHSLISRFDLLYLIIDTPDERKDAELSMHILNFYAQDFSKSTTSEDSPLSVSENLLITSTTLKRYIQFAAEKFNPIIEDSLADLISYKYVEMRRASQRKDCFPPTLRQLESLIRISEALAKLNLHSSVSLEDFQKACSLVDENFSKDSPDAYIFSAPKPSPSRDTKQLSLKLRDFLDEILDDLKNDSILFSTLYNQLLSRKDFQNLNITKEFLKSALEELVDDELIYIETKYDFNESIIRKLF